MSTTAHPDAKQIVYQCIHDQEPITHSDIVDQTSLDEADVRKAIGTLIDTSEITITRDWKFAIPGGYDGFAVPDGYGGSDFRELQKQRSGKSEGILRAVWKRLFR